MDSSPFVSILVPTRNRPELLRYCLESLTLQTFGDYEVIVSDNPSGPNGRPAKDVFDQWADGRFRYVTPPAPLAMHDNWEFAASLARGEYLAVLIDKTILRPSALQVMYRTLETHPAEVVSWWAEGYLPADEQKGYARGLFSACPSRPGSPSYFDPREELARRFRLDVRRGGEGVHYYWGKICFGSYHSDLVRRIKDRMGRLFHPIAPDYTSMVAALALARSAVDVGEPLLIQFLTQVSNGLNVATRPELALRFLEEIDPSGNLIQTLPLKGLYSSHHNLIAGDYSRMQALLGDPVLDLRVNRANLVRRSLEDLEQVMWRDESQRAVHYALIGEGVRGLTLSERGFVQRARALETLDRVLGRLRGWVVRTARALRLRRIAPPALKRAFETVVPAERAISGSYESIIAAAQVADQHYLRLAASRAESPDAPTSRRT